MDAESDKHQDATAPHAEPAISATTAFVEAFERLKRVAAGLGLAPADAQDVLQDVYVQASRKGPALPPSQATAWLVRVTVNRAMQEHRQRKQFRKATERIRRDRPPDTAASPDAVAEKTEALAAVRQAMQELDEGLLVVMTLRYFSDLDSSQIGEALGLPPGTVRKRLHDARLILAKRLMEKGFGP